MFGRKGKDQDEAEPQPVDKTKEVQAQVDDVKMIMQDNINQVIDRGEKLDVLEGKTNDLMADAKTFKKRATDTKRHMMFKNAKMMMILIIVFLVILFFIIAAACGGMTFPNCQAQ